MTPKRIVSDGFSKGRPPIAYRHRCDECPRIFMCWPCPHHGVAGGNIRRLCEACKTKPGDLEPTNPASPTAHRHIYQQSLSKRGRNY